LSVLCFDFMNLWARKNKKFDSGGQAEKRRPKGRRYDMRWIRSDRLQAGALILRRGSRARNDVARRGKSFRVGFAVALRGAQIFDLERAPNLLPRTPPQRRCGL
jgi:hypothetical protein